MRSVESGTFDQIFGSNNEKGEEEEYWNIEALYGPQTTVSPPISTMARTKAAECRGHRRASLESAAIQIMITAKGHDEGRRAII